METSDFVHGRVYFKQFGAERFMLLSKTLGCIDVRTGTLPLRIETGRFRNLNIEERDM